MEEIKKELGDYLEELLGDNEQTKILANSELSLFEKLKELDEIGYRVVEKLNTHDVMVSDLVEVENAYIEDAKSVGSYDVTGRVEQLWITKEDFNKIKCISN